MLVAWSETNSAVNKLSLVRNTRFDIWDYSFLYAQVDPQPPNATQLIPLYQRYELNNSMFAFSDFF